MYQVISARASADDFKVQAPRRRYVVMQKLFGIALIVGLIWVGISVFTNGVQATFSWLPWADKNAPAEPSPLERIRASGQSSRDAAEQRVTRQLDDRATSNHDEE
jgi:hypothetical protein